MQAGLRPDRGVGFVEQSVFSATVSQMGLKVQPFGGGYNYPIHLDPHLAQIEGSSPLEQIVSLHYHKMFTNSAVDNPISSLLSSFSNGDEILQMIDRYDVIRKLKKRPLLDLVSKMKRLLVK